MFPAYELFTLKDDIPSKIESLAAVDDNVWVGASDGNLTNIKVKPGDAAGKVRPSASLQRTRPVVSKHPIEQLEYVAGSNSLLALCDGQVHVIDAATLDIRSVVRAKGVVLFAVERLGATMKLCVALKKRLTFFEYAMGQYEPVREPLQIPDAPESMVWYNNTICLALKREYGLLNIMTGDFQPLVTVDKAHFTPYVRLLDREELILIMENIGCFFGMDGSARSRSNISWTQPPKALAYRAPYVVSLLPKSLDVHSIHDQHMVQSIKLEGVNVLCDAGTGPILAAVNRRLCALLPLPLDRQIDSLLQARRVADALELLRNALPENVGGPERNARFAEVHVKAGFKLIADGEFASGFEHLTAGQVDPREAISLFPGLLPGRQHYLPVNELRNTNIAELIARRLSDAAKGAHTPEELKAMSDAQLREAKESLARFLEAARRARRKDEAVAEAVDTALCKVYSDLGLPQLAELLRAPNACSLQDCEQFLREQKQFANLAILYESRLRRSSALDLLRRLGQGELVDPSGCVGLQETVALLQRTDEIEPILEYSSWVLAKDPELGMKVFTQRERPLPQHTDILDKLASLGNPSLSATYLEYLVTGLDVKDERYHTDLVLYHLDNALAVAKSMTGMNEKGARRLEKRAQKDKLDEKVKLCAKLRALLSVSNYYNAPLVLNRLIGSDLHEEMALVYSKMGQHEKALEIFVYALKDHEQAVRYCKEHAGDVPDIFNRLLSIDMHPDGSVEPVMTDEALRLLTVHAAYFDMVQVLNIIPPNTPVEKIETFLSRGLRHSLHVYREGQIVRNLYRAQQVQVAVAHVAERQRRVEIKERHTCPICQKRFMDEQAVAVFPNNSIVHYNCFANPHADPVTQRDFSKQPANTP